MNNNNMNYIVGNRNFPTYEEAMTYCLESDYDFHTMIEVNEDKKEETETSNLYWYEYRLRGFSLGCQPKGHVEVNHNIGRFGAIAYNRQLTEAEINDYELRECITV